jgi:predicted TIM-barrel fold metal-dependent hydrolase
VEKAADKTIPKPCLGPRPITKDPERKLPPGSWDTHFHVFGPLAKFPYAANRKYTPPESTFEDYWALAARLGIDRAVCVHPNLHGPDNAVTLDALHRSQGRFLGMVKLSPTATLADMKQMHRLGIRGVRFAFNPEHGGELDDDLYRRAENWCDELGWCIDLHMAAADLPRLADMISRTRVPVVIDHMARIDPSEGMEQLPFRVLLDLVDLDHVWIKLTGAERITRSGAPYRDVIPFARALMDAAPSQMIWGTDWPHSGVFDSSRMPDDVDLVMLPFEYAPTPKLLRQLMVENPTRLFDRSKTPE